MANKEAESLVKTAGTVPVGTTFFLFLEKTKTSKL